MDQNIVVQVKIKASAQDIYWALTDESELAQWFSEFVHISLDDGRYEFWGRLTPGNPSSEEAQQKIITANPGREIAFEWSFRGALTRVQFMLVEEGQITLVKLLHSGLPARQEGEFSAADFWMISLENLRSWVERKEIGVRCDFSKPQVGEVLLGVDIKASPAEVFETLINPEKLKRYIGENPLVEPEIGGKYSFGWDEGGPVKILSLTPNKELSYTWTYPPEPDTVVSWKLEGSGGKTRLTIVHSGFTRERRMDDYQVGWLHFLNRIKFLSELSDAWEKAQMLEDDHALDRESSKEGS
ncbi:MAG: SRPBCC domain-containing protein [Anaerolineae bacterium]|nr:SRPBCC domain-containing protein [Anaerolineae bacterium]